MFELEVYSKSGMIFLGTGYVFHHKYGMTEPTLIDIFHKPLPEGWYTLKCISDGKLVVLSRSIH